MDDAVDRVMTSYENLPALERFGREEIRVKVGQYLEKLSSAGHSDAEELTVFGLAYLRILHKDPDPPYTGEVTFRDTVALSGTRRDLPKVRTHSFTARPPDLRRFP